MFIYTLSIKNLVEQILFYIRCDLQLYLKIQAETKYNPDTKIDPATN